MLGHLDSLHPHLNLENLRPANVEASTQSQFLKNQGPDPNFIAERVNHLTVNIAGIICTENPESLNKHHFQLKEANSANKVASVKEVSRVDSQSQDLEKMSGSIWECISSIPGDYGGFIYTFKAKEESDFITHPIGNRDIQQETAEKRRETFPAIESTCYFDLYLDQTLDRIDFMHIMHTLMKSSWSKELETEISDHFVYHASTRDVLNQLGYACTLNFEGKPGVYLSFPDKEELMGSWKMFRRGKEDIPELEIVSEEGIAGDLEFVRAYLTKDAILSTGREFVHDQTMHIMPLLRGVITSNAAIQKAKVSRNRHIPKSYVESKSELRAKVYTFYQTISVAKQMIEERRAPRGQALILQKHLPKIETVLGAIADSISSEDDPGSINIGELDIFFNTKVWSPEWADYWDKRYPGEEMSPELVTTIWNQLKEIEDQFLING